MGVNGQMMLGETHFTPKHTFHHSCNSFPSQLTFSSPTCLGGVASVGAGVIRTVVGMGFDVFGFFGLKKLLKSKAPKAAVNCIVTKRRTPTLNKSFIFITKRALPCSVGLDFIDFEILSTF